MNKPKVSIGLPVYNGQAFLDRALECILKQDFEDFELIISDNASVDETGTICKSYAERDNRIQYSRNDVNIGAAGNYNKVFHAAKGKYFRWMAHDDECRESLLRRCVEYLDDSPEFVTMVYARGELIDVEGKTLLPGLDRIESRDPRPYRRLSRILWSLNYCDPIFGLIKSDILRKTQLIGAFFGADNVLLGQLALRGEIRELSEILFRLRAHSQRSMQANPSARARAAWYDPSAANRIFILPDWERMVLEMLKAVLNSDLPPVEKRKCFLTVLGVHYWRRIRSVGGRYKCHIKSWITANQALFREIMK
jgi:glycosyltransferase involved in cell wall biosynthesis